MSTQPETKQPTEMETLAKEYGIHCAQLGEHEYKIRMLTAESITIVEKLKELNQKADQIKKAELPMVGATA